MNQILIHHIQQNDLIPYSEKMKANESELLQLSATMSKNDQMHLSSTMNILIGEGDEKDCTLISMTTFN